MSNKALSIMPYLKGITKMLDTHSACGGFRGYKSLEHFIMSHGVPMNRVSPLPLGLPLMTKKECFRNCYCVAAKGGREDYIYCEGLAVTDFFPIMHAWLIDRHGYTYDTTWGEDGTEYYGIAINRTYLKSRIRQQDHYGLLDAPEAKWPLLNDHPRQAERGMDLKISYTGTRTQEGTALVEKHGLMTRELPIAESLKLANHSPTGFEWGYAGSGPAQLALAILLDFTSKREFALENYQRFKFDVVAQMPKAGWSLPGELIQHWIDGGKLDWSQ